LLGYSLLIIFAVESSTPIESLSNSVCSPRKVTYFFIFNAGVFTTIALETGNFAYSNFEIGFFIALDKAL